MTLRCAEALTYRNYFYMITIANFVTKFNRTNNVLRYLNLSNWQHMTTKVNIWLSQIEIICKRELYKDEIVCYFLLILWDATIHINTEKIDINFLCICLYVFFVFVCMW